MSAQEAFKLDLPLMWKWEECNSFDVASGSTQILPSHHALKFTWGEHCHHLLLLYLGLTQARPELHNVRQ